jgi:tetratricopeptide (TPR) repeat protein
MSRIVILSLCFALVGTADLTAQPTTAQKLSSEARKAQMAGDLPNALKTYQKAEESAKTSGDRRVEGDAILNRARVTESLKGFSDAKLLYQRAIEIAAPQQRVVAQNDLAVSLFKQQRFGEAVDQFRQIDLDQALPSHRPIYTYNYARALETQKQFTQAYQKYTNAVGQQPKFEAAAEAAFSILRRGELFQPASNNIIAAAQLADQLLSKGQFDLAARELHSSLKLWANEPEALRLLVGLVRYYIAAAVGPTEFQQREMPMLASLGDNALVRPIVEIRAAYFGDFKPTFKRTEAAEILPSWEKSPWRTDFARLLKKVGDFYDRQKLPEKALSRFTLAWTLDMQYTESCLYAAAMLLDQSERLDREHVLFNQMIDAIFMGKGEAYLGEDWVSILRFHTILGIIFEQEKKWGSSFDPRSAIFQWEHALRAEEVIRRRDPKFPAQPGLRLGLAKAFNQSGRTRAAWEEYLKAVEGFVGNQNAQEAASALETAKTLKVQLGTADRERLSKLEADLAKLK